MDFKTLPIVLSFLLLFSLCVAGWPSLKFGNDIIESLEKEVKVVKSSVKFAKLKLWTNCGQASDPIVVKNLTLSPQPVRVPGNITVSGAVIFKENLVSPISVKVTMEAKEFFWITLPCEDNVGSCSYANVCAMMPPSQQCPPQLVKIGLQCKCPVKAGTYVVPPLSVALPKPPISVPATTLKVKAEFSHKEQALGCYQLEFAVN
ncbi:ganglioside GM2 activator [Lingula anatina]|uniref:Ganglioside GM2 activator n=1 Tax=Lingula anatina TaxID=7574 RepID=A0A1S3JGT2_LINAN|nr:ganglioside GM2 activator [Lingula anatina]XP_013409567.1 ganglioside GM2 activator [Lingula anatina]XP_013409568.1 ganglioside GM2 activator [Lingula anatina]|eukprot:XP_013409566.1 ganglioside GM2 activator [Lingula anatina]